MPAFQILLLWPDDIRARAKHVANEQKHIRVQMNRVIAGLLVVCFSFVGDKSNYTR